MPCSSTPGLCSDLALNLLHSPSSYSLSSLLPQLCLSSARARMATVEIIMPSHKLKLLSQSPCVSKCGQEPRVAGSSFASLGIAQPQLVHFLNTSLAAPGALAHRLQRRTACQWAPKWPTGSGKVSTPRFWGAPVNFR